MITKRSLMLSGAALAASETMLAAAAWADDQTAGASAQSRAYKLPSDVVYIESNIAAAGQNSILGYSRAANGRLTPLAGSPFPTGGTGFFFQNPPFGPFDTDQEIVLDRQNGVLYAVNSGSSSVAAMRIGSDGALQHIAGSPFPTPGINPVSVGLHGNSVVVLNADADPAQAVAGSHPTAVVAAIINPQGGLAALRGRVAGFPAGSVPSQVLTDKTGRFIFICEFVGKKILSFTQNTDGSLQLRDSKIPPQQSGATSAPLPLGLWAHDQAPILYVGFATTNQLGVYRWDSLGKLTFLRTATNSGEAICWLRTGFNGYRLYSVNTADNSVSVYDTSDPEKPREIQYLKLGGLGALVQFSVTPDSRFLYIIEQATTPAAEVQGNRLRVLAVDSNDGFVREIVEARLDIPVPALTIPVGVVTL